MKKINVFGTVLTTIILGALGSALWDFAKHPLEQMILVFGEYVPNFFPFSTSQLYENASKATAAELRGRSSVPLILAAGGLFLMTSHAIAYITIKSTVSSGFNNKAAFGNISVLIFTAIITIWSGFHTYEWTMSARIARGYEYGLRICGNELSYERRLEIDQSFALMRTTAEYNAIMSSIKCSKTSKVQ